ncbi:MAG: hypothetical protein ABL962_09475 [Fimbriimonadaceae bacterium]
MKRLIIIFSLIVVHFAVADDPKSPAKEASADYRTTLAATKALSVFEGLPHQTWDRDLLAQEIKREDKTKIWKYPFYTPSVLATNADELKQLLSSPDAIEVYGGPKLCGGYHPDYCLSWEAEDKTYNALICFGCHEVVFFDGKATLIYDLHGDAHKRLKELLSIYAKKRPRQPKG